MKHAARTLFAFSLYLFGLGLVLLLAPNPLLGVFGIAPTHEVWIHVIGMLVLFLGVYYWVAARGGQREFMRWTIALRASVIVFFAGFVAVGWAPPALLLFGLVDLAGAAWTWSALARPAVAVGAGAP